MKKTVRNIFIGVGAALLLILAAVVLAFLNELRSLFSLKQMNSAPFYAMTYYGDYGFDDFLKQGAHSDAEIEQFVTKRLLKGLPIDLGITGGGCSAFYAHNEAGDGVYGRNFDFDYAPPLLLHTKPADGYASVSTVNLAFLGYSEQNLPKERDINSFLTLAAPYLPFDGMNEKGLAVALLAVPEAYPPNKDGQVTLNTTTAIRLMLDKAATVEEAVVLLKDYNIYFSGDIQCHYLVADATGNAVVLEFWDHELKVVKAPDAYPAATNFVMYNGLNIGEGFTEFDRYDAIQDRLAQSGGVLGEAEAMRLLEQVSIPDRTQWSVVYNTKKLTAAITIRGDYGSLCDYTLQ